MIKGIYYDWVRIITLPLYIGLLYLIVNGFDSSRFSDFSGLFERTQDQLFVLVPFFIYLLFKRIRVMGVPMLVKENGIIKVKDSNDTVHEIIQSTIVSIKETRYGIRVKYVDSGSFFGYKTAIINKSLLSIAEIADLHNILLDNSHYSPNKLVNLTPGGAGH